MIVNYGAISGAILEKVDLRKLLGKRVNIHFTTLLSRSDEYKSELIKEFSSSGVLQKIENKEIKVLVHKKFEFSEEGINTAHEIMKDNLNTGKLIVEI